MDHIRSWRSWKDVMFPITATSISKEFDSGKLYVHGQDSLGHPLLVYNPHLNRPKERNIEEFVLLFVYMMEVAMKKLPPHLSRVSILLNRSSLSEPDYEMGKRFQELMRKYYPLRVYKIFVSPVNVVLKACWKVMKLFLSEEAAAHVKPKTGIDALRMVIPPQYIPEELGGDCRHRFNPNDIQSPFLTPYSNKNAEDESSLSSSRTRSNREHTDWSSAKRMR